MKKVLVIEALGSKEIMRIQQDYFSKNMVIFYKPNFDKDQLQETIKNYDAIIVGSHDISADLIEKWRASKPYDKLAIIKAGASTHAIDKIAAKKHNVVVMNTYGLSSSSVTEFILNRVLNYYHEDMLSLADRDINHNTIKKRENYFHNYVMNKKVALIGTGAIGSRLAKIFVNLGAIVNAYSPNFTEIKAKELGVIYCPDIETAVENADILSVQVTFKDKKSKDSTYKLINEKHLRLLNNNSIVINISKINVVDMDDLLEVIKTDKIGRFVLDTASNEIEGFIEEHPEVLYNKKFYLTPTIATASYELLEVLTDAAIIRAHKYLFHNHIIDQVC